MLRIKPIYVPREGSNHLCVVALVVFSLNEAGLRTVICKAPLSQEASRVELPLSYCSPSASQPRDTAVLEKGEPPASHLTTCVCEQNSFNAKGRGRMKKLAFVTNP